MNWSADQARPLDDARRAAILEANDALAGEALRTLGVAFRLLPAGRARQKRDSTKGWSTSWCSPG